VVFLTFSTGLTQAIPYILFFLVFFFAVERLRKMVAAKRDPAPSPAPAPAGASSSDASSSNAELHYFQQLELAKQQISEHCKSTEEKLLSAAARAGADVDAWARSEALHGGLDNLARQVLWEAEALSETHRKCFKEALKTQLLACDFKLGTTRKAAAMKLEAARVEMQAAMDRKLEDAAMDALGKGSEVLQEVRRRNEELAAELDGERRRLQAKDEALATARVKAAEWQEKAEAAAADAEQQRVAAERHEAELERCKEMMDKALEALDVNLLEKESLQAKVHEFVRLSEQQRAECEEARMQLHVALKDLGVVTDENLSLV
jgi:chromosome segregation ATPase